MQAFDRPIILILVYLRMACRAKQYQVVVTIPLIFCERTRSTCCIRLFTDYVGLFTERKWSCNGSLVLRKLMLAESTSVSRAAPEQFDVFLAYRHHLSSIGV
jgi:hypothetical protein